MMKLGRPAKLHVCVKCGISVKGIWKEVRRQYYYPAKCGDCRNQFPRLSHGLSAHPIYSTWQALRRRCFDTRCREYKHYGGRGIVMFAAWLDPVVFIAWASTHGWQSGLQIDRIDNDGHYVPENCRFVVPVINVNNRKNTRWVTVNGQKMLWKQAHAMYAVSGLCWATFRTRLSKGWEIQYALRTKVAESHGRFVRGLPEHVKPRKRK